MEPSALYHEGNRRLQDAFDSRRIADRLEAVNLRTAFSERDRQLIEGCHFFFLATADPSGQPHVSHKGGLPGFIRVIGPAELAYPDYDGNGMFVSLGNVAVNPQVGLLFIDFERPRRLIVHARAAFSRDDPLLPLTVGAQMIVRLSATAIYPNCPRYIPGMRLVEPSHYAPRPGAAPVEPAWKSFAEFKDAVHPRQKTSDGR